MAVDQKTMQIIAAELKIEMEKIAKKHGVTLTHSGFVHGDHGEVKFKLDKLNEHGGNEAQARLYRQYAKMMGVDETLLFQNVRGADGHIYKVMGMRGGSAKNSIVLQRVTSKTIHYAPPEWLRQTRKVA